MQIERSRAPRVVEQEIPTPAVPQAMPSPNMAPAGTTAGVDNVGEGEDRGGATAVEGDAALGGVQVVGAGNPLEGPLDVIQVDGDGAFKNTISDGGLGADFRDQSPASSVRQ